MSETRLVSVRRYNDTAVGHVSVGLESGIYEQQWSQESYAGLFFSQAGPNDVSVVSFFGTSGGLN